MKISYALTAVSLGLLIGGPVYIQVSGYDALSSNFWIESMKVFISEPMIIINAAFGGELAEGVELFRGIVMVALGAFMLLTTQAFALIGPAIRHKKRVKGKKIKFEKVEKSSENEFSDGDVEPAKKQSSLSSIKEKLATKKAGKRSNSSSGVDAFVDESFEGDDDNTPGIADKFKGFFEKKKSSKLENKKDQEMWNRAVEDSAVPYDVSSGDYPDEDGKQREEVSVPEKEKKSGMASAKIKKKTASIRMGNDSFGQKISGFFSGIMSSKKTKLKESNEEVYSVEDKEESNVVASVFDWYKDVQGGERSKGELVEEAKQLVQSMTESDREAILEKNSMDGSFMIRLMESWSSRDAFDEGEEGVDSRAMIREAIRAVKKGKAGDFEVDESALPDDLKGGIDDEDVYEEIEEDVDLKDEKNVYPEEENTTSPLEQKEETITSGDEDDNQNDSEEADDDQDEKIVEKIGRVAMEMRWLMSQAQMVFDGQDEWPEHLGNEDFRMEEVSRLEEEMGRLMFLFDDEEMKEILSKQDGENFEWLLDNFEIVTQGFESFAKEAMSDDEDDDGNHDAEDDESPVESDVQKETESGDAEGIEEDSSEDIQEEKELNEDSIEKPNDDEYQEEEDENSEPLTDEQNMEAALANIAQQRDEEEASEIMQEEGLEEKNEDEVETEEGTENQDNDTSVQDSTEDKMEKENAEEILPQIKEPKNVGKSDMEEMGLASKEVMVWGTVSKKAGAGAGTMMRFLFERGSEEILPVGSVHLVAIWKEQGKIDKRMNVILKYLEEGNWVFDPSKPGHFMREDEDFVEVSESILKHPEMKDNVVVIHAHGPGATSLGLNNPVEWSKDIWLVSNVMTEDEMRKAVS